MKLNSISLLKTEVEKIFGKRIQSSSDCHTLCNEILRTSDIKISFNTIRRFFNLMKADGSPSSYTLNALSNYCGFQSFDKFIGIRQQNAVPQEQEQEQDPVLLNFLILFFKQIEVCKKNDITYLSLVQQTIMHLDQHRFIIDSFQREIAKTKNGQSFYFEQFVFVDKLNSYYGAGLQYYLNEKKTKEAQLFGYSLLCYHSWLTQNNVGIEKYFRKVMQQGLNTAGSQSVNARYFTTQLFYADALALDQESILMQAKQFYLSTLKLKDNNLTSNCFEIIMAEALILTGNYENALFYLEEILKEVKRNIPSYIEVALYENICLFKAIVFANTGKKMKAYEILKDINPNKFSFLSRKFMNILYFSIRQMFRNVAVEQEQIHQSIRETGFTRLLSVYDSYSVETCEEVGKFGQKMIAI